MFYVHYLNSLLRLLATDHSNEPNNTALTYFLCKVTRSPQSLSGMTNSDHFRVSLFSYIPSCRNCSESTASIQGKLGNTSWFTYLRWVCQECSKLFFKLLLWWWAILCPTAKGSLVTLVNHYSFSPHLITEDHCASLYKNLTQSTSTQRCDF